jgi:hypothetical protein
MWFKSLTGFDEESRVQVQSNLSVNDNIMTSKVNGNKFVFGNLQIPTLGELQNACPNLNSFTDKIKVSEIVADVQELHAQLENENALFQVASQFNLLEMVGPNITPEHGIDRYEHDRTQGPACAIACGAGTIYRNYFVNIGDQIGQTSSNQIDCLCLIDEELNNKEQQHWEMKNGYALINNSGIKNINKTLEQFNDSQREALKQKLKVGIQWNTEVTLATTKHLVSQIYCSALPVSYYNLAAHNFEKFARLILEATYEATFYAGLINYKNTGSNKVYLTLVGGGVFGNEVSWIIDSIQKTITKFKNCPLNIQIVSYKNTNPNLKDLIR